MMCRSRIRLRTHCSQPECDGCGDADGREEGMGASVVAGSDAPPVLEPSGHVLDLVALPIERLFVGDLDLAALR